MSAVADIVRDLAPGAVRGIAVAVNGGIVPRAEWPTFTLHDGDSVEVLTAVQGG